VSNTDFPLMASLEVKSSKNELTVSDMKLNIGHSDLTGEFSRKWDQGEISDFLTLKAELVDINQLTELFTSNEDKTGDSGHTELDLDIPILPAGLLQNNTEIELNVKQIAIGKAVFRDTTFYSNIVEGHVEVSEVSTNTGNTHFEGEASLVVTGELPEIRLILETDDIDIGKLLSDIRISDDLNIKSEHLNIEVSLIGRTLEEVLEKSGFNIITKNTVWYIVDGSDTNDIKIEISDGLLKARHNEPIHITLDARYNDTPVKINMETGNLIKDLDSTKQKFSLNLDAEIPGANLTIRGWGSYPLSQKVSELSVLITGDSLDSINNTLRLDLPRTSPYTMSADIQTSGDAYLFKDIEITMGNSTIMGSVNFVQSGDYKNLDIELYSNSIELTDFIKREEKKNINPAAPITKKSGTDGKEDKKVLEFEPIISALDLKTIYAQLKLNFDKILLKDHLVGDVEINGDLEGGKLTVNHFEIHTPGGMIGTLLEAQIIENVITFEQRLNYYNSKTL